MASTKVNYALETARTAGDLVEMQARLDSIYDRYFANLYGSGGDNEITEADLSGMDITPADLASFITLCEQFEKFFSNQAVTAGDYRSTLMKLYHKNV